MKSKTSYPSILGRVLFCRGYSNSVFPENECARYSRQEISVAIANVYYGHIEIFIHFYKQRRNWYFLEVLTNNTAIIHKFNRVILEYKPKKPLPGIWPLKIIGPRITVGIINTEFAKLKKDLNLTDFIECPLLQPFV